MKTNYSLINIGLAACLLLAGCGNGVPDSPADKPKEQMEEAKEQEASKYDNEQPRQENIEVSESAVDTQAQKDSKEQNDSKEQKAPKETVDAIDYESVYEPVFDEILEIIEYGYNFDREYKYASGALTEKIEYNNGGDLLKDIGYVLTDFSKDGVPELLIGCDDNYDESGLKSYIYCIFTVKDDKPHPVVECGPRSIYQYAGEDKFFYSGSGGVSVTIFGLNHLSKDGTEIEWEDFYFTDEKDDGRVGIYHNKTGVFEAGSSEELDISQEQFVQIMDDYKERCERISWNPIGNYKSVKKPADTKNSSGSSGVDESEPYCGVLYWYKELQDSGKTWEEMEEYTSQTELVQHGWPYASNNDEVRYVYQDITGDGYDELIITYYNEPVDIYANEGDAVYAYGVPYRAVASVFPDGYIREDVTLGVKGFQTTWYKYDDATHKYISTKEEPDQKTSGITFPEGKRIADVVR